jgi:type III secretory pathway component EscV
MTAIVLAFVKRFGGWILGILASLAFVLTLWASVRKSAKDDAKVFQAEQTYKAAEAEAAREIVKVEKAAEVATKVLEAKNEIAVENSRTSDSDVVKRLRDEWSRD